MVFCTFKMLVQVIEQSDGCIYNLSAGPKSKLHWVKVTLNLFNVNFVSCSKVFLTIEAKALSGLLWKPDFIYRYDYRLLLGVLLLGD